MIPAALRAALPLVVVAVLLRPAVAQAEAAGPPALVVAVDGGVGDRRFHYRDDLFGTLRPYDLAAAPVVGGEIAIFPGAFFTQERGAWFGIHVRGEGMPGLNSHRNEHEAALPTRAWALEGTVRTRVPFSFGAVWTEVGAAARTFSIQGVGITVPDVPSVRYLGPHIGFGVEIGLRHGLSLAPRIGASIWSRMGEVASPAWFPGATGGGVDLGLRLAWALPRGFAPYLDIAWSREILALHPEPGDAHVAGGASDDNLAARLGISWTFARHPAP